MPDLSVVVVLYNTEANDSAALRCVEHAGGAIIGNVIVCDNSTIPTDNDGFCKSWGFQYVSMGANVGLSKAYNEAIRRIRDGWILFLDQDTEVDESFFRALSAGIAKPEGALFMAPVVRDGRGILSPCRLKGAWARRIRTVDQVETDSSFINSGSCFHRSVFDHITYDEGYFLDFIDHDFMNRFKHIFGISTMRLLPVAIRQSFSGTDHSDRSRDLRRFAIYRRDFSRYCRNTTQSRSVCAAMLGLRALKLAVLHRHAGFLRILFCGEQGAA